MPKMRSAYPETFYIPIKLAKEHGSHLIATPTKKCAENLQREFYTFRKFLRINASSGQPWANYATVANQIRFQPQDSGLLLYYIPSKAETTPLQHTPEHSL